MVIPIISIIILQQHVLYNFRVSTLSNSKNMAKVLICEDEEIMLTALVFRMKKQNFEVHIARDGKEAMKYLETEIPDVIVADIMMPHVTGLELIQYLRRDLNSQVPVIIISALEMDEVVLEAFRIGANDFITKPFKPNELVLRVRRLVDPSYAETTS
jgi:DNA-binding response OmpR family regulator